MSVITVPFGYLMSFLYGVTANYGVSIILFSILIKIVLLPLSYKQQKSSVQMGRLQPELQALQKKYKNDKEKLNKETMELYKKHGASPLSGCLPVLLQFPIMIGLYQVIIHPLTYMYRLSAEVVTQLQTAAGLADNVSQITLAEKLTPEIISSVGLNIPPINFNFLTLNLADTPNFQIFSLLWLIPILSGLSSYASQKFAQRLQPAQPDGSNATASMLIIFPLMSVFFCFTLPAGIGVYWIMQSLTAMLQQWVLTVYINRQPVKEMVTKDSAADNNAAAPPRVEKNVKDKNKKNR